MNGALYSIEILRLAASTAHFHRLEMPDGSAEKRSPLCGSRITVDVKLDGEGRVSEIGQDVRACAFGQASTALMTHSAVGKTLHELVAATCAIKDWLRDGGEYLGDWPGLSVFEPALPHKARHPAILLAFDAVTEAVSKARART